MAFLSIKLVRYSVVGILTLAIYLVTGEVMHRLELAVVWQASLSFTSAVTVNYLLQRAWVFGDSRPTVSSLPRYLVMIVIGYFINILSLITFSQHMPLLLAQLGACVLVVVSNAFFSFSWVFLKGGGSAKQDE